MVSRAAAGSCVWVGFVGERWPCSSSGCQRLEGWALVTSWVRLTQTPELRVPCAPRPRVHPAVSGGTRGHGRTGNLDGGWCCLLAAPLLCSADTLPQGQGPPSTVERLHPSGPLSPFTASHSGRVPRMLAGVGRRVSGQAAADCGRL